MWSSIISLFSLNKEWTKKYTGTALRTLTHNTWVVSHALIINDHLLIRRKFFFIVLARIKSEHTFKLWTITTTNDDIVKLDHRVCLDLLLTHNRLRKSTYRSMLKKHCPKQNNWNLNNWVHSLDKNIPSQVKIVHHNHRQIILIQFNINPTLLGNTLDPILHWEEGQGSV